MDKNIKLMTAEEYNSAVKKWYMQVRARAAANIRAASSAPPNKYYPKLSSSLVASSRLAAGEVESVAFKFPRHGIYVHYGVGRGYIRSGNNTVRGYKTQPKHASAEVNGTIKRHPVDWIDKEISNRFENLADIAGSYYGDRAMRAVLLGADNLKIDKQ